jgi:hypothetical protein
MHSGLVTHLGNSGAMTSDCIDGGGDNEQSVHDIGVSRAQWSSGARA